MCAQLLHAMKSIVTSCRSADLQTISCAMQLLHLASNDTPQTSNHPTVATYNMLVLNFCCQRCQCLFRQA